MDSSDAIQLVILFVLIGLSAFFSSAETAFVTVNKIRIRNLAEEGSERAETVTKIIDNSSKMLSAVLIGNNIVNLSASSIATALAIKLWGSIAAGVATGFLTIIILIFGEITPKTLATIYSEKITLAYGKVIYGMMIVFTPVIFVVEKLSLGFLMLFRINPNAHINTMTENELRTIVDVSHEEGVIEPEERKMINNVFDFGDSLARDVMVPKVDMTFAHVDNTYEELIDIYKEDKFTRIPIYEENTDNVIGILNMKDVILCRGLENFHIRDIMREPYFTYEYKKTSELLIDMQKESFSMTIVLDEYGTTVGLITLEDLLEEIVGEIRDEFDENEENMIRKINDYEYLVEGSMKLDDLNEQIDLDLESEDYDSIGGIIIGLLDDLPKEGDTVTTENRITLVADKMDNNRIDIVHIYLPKAVGQDDAAEK